VTKKKHAKMKVEPELWLPYVILLWLSYVILFLLEMVIYFPSNLSLSLAPRMLRTCNLSGREASHPVWYLLNCALCFGGRKASHQVRFYYIVHFLFGDWLDGGAKMKEELKTEGYIFLDCLLNILGGEK
jgi:hypothetical protein